MQLWILQKYGLIVHWLTKQTILGGWKATSVRLSFYEREDYYVSQNEYRRA